MSDEAGSDEFNATEIMFNNQRFVPEERVKELEAERDRLREAGNSLVDACLDTLASGCPVAHLDEAVHRMNAALEGKG